MRACWCLCLESTVALASVLAAARTFEILQGSQSVLKCASCFAIRTHGVHLSVSLHPPPPPEHHWRGKHGSHPAVGGSPLPPCVLAKWAARRHGGCGTVRIRESLASPVHSNTGRAGIAACSSRRRCPCTYGKQPKRETRCLSPRVFALGGTTKQKTVQSEE